MNVAYIPVRGGSKSIPLKNIKLIAGKPLVYWAILAACESRNIDKVFISTDHDEISRIVSKFGYNKVEIISRSAESAMDTASTEYGMLEFARERIFDNIVLIQATSPLITSFDLDCGFEVYGQEGVDSVLSVVRQKRFVWNDGQGRYAVPINYDYNHRPRRQDFDGLLIENGAFYITGREALLRSECRISGNIKTVEMSEQSYHELDEYNDWKIVEMLLLSRLGTKRDHHFIPQIRMFLTDCDGCLTDGGIYYSKAGEELKKFNTRDGFGLRLLKENGIITGIITGENTEIVRKRAEKLNVDVLLMGVTNKLAAIKELCQKYSIDINNIAYVGDDLNDLEVIQQVGFGCCVSNGMEKVKAASNYITKCTGGEGAIREVVELILENR